MNSASIDSFLQPIAPSNLPLFRAVSTGEQEIARAVDSAKAGSAFMKGLNRDQHLPFEVLSFRPGSPTTYILFDTISFLSKSSPSETPPIPRPNIFTYVKFDLQALCRGELVENKVMLTTDRRE
jgi:hypothetical protein